MKNPFFVFASVLIFCIILISCKSDNQASGDSKSDVPPLDKSLAKLPPMGWNSWDCFGWTVNEAQVKANADFIAKNLKHLGYEYVVIDATWYGDAAASDFEAFVQETIPVKPNYTIDEYGRLQPDTIKFPSAKGGKGFKPLADYVHSLGLKLGLHMMRGIPWKAGEDGRKIKGTDYLCSTISQPDSGCVWYDGFYGIDMKKPGAQEYYNSVYEQYAEWGLDYIKADDMVKTADLIGTSEAIRRTKRPIVLSVVPEDVPMDVLQNNVHMARTGIDFWDVWEMLKKGFPVANKMVKNQQEGFWPDLDMLPVGKIGIGLSYKGPLPRISNFTKAELNTLMTLYYITRSPLMIGGHLPESDAHTIQLLQNAEALEVNRKGKNPRQIKFKNAHIIWAADSPVQEEKYLAFFNQWESKEPIKPKVTWKQLGLEGSEYKVRDLWAKKDLGSFKDGFSTPISAHNAGLYKIYK
ncbi:MAG: glycoside hydrolase family 27 protein [Leadbetterella sp.]